jgi:hypothetical protein
MLPASLIARILAITVTVVLVLITVLGLIAVFVLIQNAS